jgi:hypothetical protein
MRKLSLSEWSSLAEVVASVAVVISLVFVGFSINQNSHILKASNDSLIFEIQDSIMSQKTGDPVLASIEVKLQSGEEITAIEAKQWEWHLWRWMAAWELAFNRHTDELMDDDDWRGWDRAFELTLLDPEIGLAEEFWIADRFSWGSDFAAHVDAAYTKHQQD